MSLSTLTGAFGSIYVPASLVTAYKTATNWATYADRITAIEGDSGEEGGGGDATIINFTIDGTSYQAEAGMTWGEWVESDYNTGGFTVGIEDYLDIEVIMLNDMYVLDGMSYLYLDSEIVSGMAYNLDIGGFM